jgi:hypothetical protein
MADDDHEAKVDDYEYDEAHDAAEATSAPPADRPPVLRQPAAMHVADDAGDYSYDAAHDRA